MKTNLIELGQAISWARHKLAEYIADTEGDGESDERRGLLLALERVTAETIGDLRPHVDLIYHLAPCDWSFDAICCALEAGI